MKVEQVLHMNGGSGGKYSYANHSSMQPILRKSIAHPLLVLSEIIDIVNETCKRVKHSPPYLQAFLNDLPGNDFNVIFQSLPSFYERLEGEKGNNYFGKCFIAGAPGSFYGRLFPNNCLHFFHSSYAIMWISKPPKELVTGTSNKNKGNICVTKTSSPHVHKAYLKQFQANFSLFLRCRAEEMVPGGRMLLTTMGSIQSNDPLSIWELVGLKLNQMVSEGLIEEEKLESFDLPYYAATKEVKKVTEAEGSFRVQRLEAFNMDWDDHLKKGNGNLDKAARAAIIAQEIRAVGEPILGKDIMDDLFLLELAGQIQPTVSQVPRGCSSLHGGTSLSVYQHSYVLTKKD